MALWNVSARPSEYNLAFAVKPGAFGASNHGACVLFRLAPCSLDATATMHPCLYAKHARAVGAPSCCVLSFALRLSSGCAVDELEPIVRTKIVKEYIREPGKTRTCTVTTRPMTKQ